MDIAVIGAGRVGTALAVLLPAPGTGSSPSPVARPPPAAPPASSRDALLARPGGRERRRRRPAWRSRRQRWNPCLGARAFPRPVRPSCTYPVPRARRAAAGPASCASRAAPCTCCRAFLRSRPPPNASPAAPQRYHGEAEGYGARRTPRRRRRRAAIPAGRRGPAAVPRRRSPGLERRRRAHGPGRTRCSARPGIDEPVAGSCRSPGRASTTPGAGRGRGARRPRRPRRRRHVERNLDTPCCSSAWLSRLHSREWLGGGPLRDTSRLRLGYRDLQPGVVPVRYCRQHPHAGGRPHPAGLRRRHDGAGRPPDPGAHVRAR